MNKLNILRTSVARPNTSKKYKETFNYVTFHSKVNIRRKLRPKTAKYGCFVDIEHDFNVGDNYDGPVLSAGQPVDQIFIDELQRFFLTGGLLHRKYVYRILSMVEDVYRKDPLLVDVELPKEAIINICGDIHGQYYDLLKILKLRGQPCATTRYLFNGDIVDKGKQSLECILLLFAYKLAYPEYVYINRGNHESAVVNVKHGFYREVGQKYTNDFFLFEFFAEVFKWMPIAHLIHNRILVVHGGIPASPSLILDDIRSIQKPVEAQDNETVAGLLWSDPIARDGILPSTRGIGVFFGPDITKRFLDKNNLTCIVRSHAEIRAGCGLSHPGCYTVFSAPNEQKGILGGLIVISGEDFELQGNIFTECCKEEADAFLEGKSEYRKPLSEQQPEMT